MIINQFPTANDEANISNNRIVLVIIIAFEITEVPTALETLFVLMPQGCKETKNNR